MPTLVNMPNNFWPNLRAGVGCSHIWWEALSKENRKEWRRFFLSILWNCYILPPLFLHIFFTHLIRSRVMKGWSLLQLELSQRTRKHSLRKTMVRQTITFKEIRRFRVFGLSYLGGFNQKTLWKSKPSHEKQRIDWATSPHLFDSFINLAPPKIYIFLKVSALDLQYLIITTPLSSNYCTAVSVSQSHLKPIEWHFNTSSVLV